MLSVKLFKIDHYIAVTTLVILLDEIVNWLIVSYIARQTYRYSFSVQHKTDCSCVLIRSFNGNDRTGFGFGATMMRRQTRIVSNRKQLISMGMRSLSSKLPKKSTICVLIHFGSFSFSVSIPVRNRTIVRTFRYILCVSFLSQSSVYNFAHFFFGYSGGRTSFILICRGRQQNVHLNSTSIKCDYYALYHMRHAVSLSVYTIRQPAMVQVYEHIHEHRAPNRSKK